MDSMREILRERSIPGILVFDMENNLLFSNSEGTVVLPDAHDLSEEICGLRDKAKQRFRDRSTVEPEDSDGAVMKSGSGTPYSLRAFLIGKQGEEAEPTHIMILIERIIERHDIDFQKVKDKFSFTNREMDVLRLICSGLTNREISERLCISEYTVKDHIKNVMEKMKAKSRGEIMASIK